MLGTLKNEFCGASLSVLRFSGCLGIYLGEFRGYAARRVLNSTLPGTERFQTELSYTSENSRANGVSGSRTQRLSHDAFDACDRRGGQPLERGTRRRPGELVQPVLVSRIRLHSPSRVLARTSPGSDPGLFSAHPRRHLLRTGESRKGALSKLFTRGSPKLPLRYNRPREISKARWRGAPAFVRF